MNVSEMSRSEVNEAIAKLRDAWHYAAGPGGTTGPDYCHDWAACGPLLEAMPRWSLFSPRKHSPGYTLCLDDWSEPGPTHATALEAVARAWLQWKTEVAS